jgi:hypothetical protein
MADAVHMDVSGASNVGQEYAVGVAVKAMRAAKVQGEGAVQLIEGAAKVAPPPVGSAGQGVHVNTYG